MDEKFCHHIGCNNAGEHVCSGCGNARYCSKECQKTCWKSHKLECQMAQDMENIVKLTDADFSALYETHGPLTDKILKKFIEESKFYNKDFILSQLKKIIDPSYFIRTFDVALEASAELIAMNMQHAANSGNNYVVRKTYSDSILDRSKCTTCFNLFKDCCCKLSSKPGILAGMGLSVLGDMASFDEKTPKQLKIENNLNLAVLTELLFKQPPPPDGLKERLRAKLRQIKNR
jgi:hypothetical protein